MCELICAINLEMAEAVVIPGSLKFGGISCIWEEVFEHSWCGRRGHWLKNHTWRGAESTMGSRRSGAATALPGLHGGSPASIVAPCPTLSRDSRRPA
jgi:hypothetical protein